MKTAWRFSGVSVTGASHVKQSKACEDAHYFRFYNELMILAVADGAGSAANAAIGSKAAVRSAVRKLYNLLSSSKGSKAAKSIIQSALKETFIHVHRRLGDIADNMQIDLSELNTTLLVVVCGPDFTAAGQIGDGLIAGAQNGKTGFLIRPEQREYVNTTHFITDFRSLSTKCRFWFSGCPVDHIAMTTDGLEPVAVVFKNGELFTPFFQRLFQFMTETESDAIRFQALKKLVQGQKLTTASDDDKTLVLAYRNTSSG